MSPADVNLRMLALRLSPGNPFLTHIAMKPHKPKLGEADPGPSLFIAGLPLNFGEEAVEAVFSCFGTVLQVVLHGTKRSGMVVFEEAEAVSSALASAESRSIIEWTMPTDEEGPVGVKAWVQQHKALRPGNAVLQKQLDDWMEDFDLEEERKEKARQAAMAEDGWTVVVRSKGRAKTTTSGGATTRGGGVTVAAAETAKAKADGQVINNFYRFQQRDKRRSELLDLRKQFDLDRKRIAEMRQGRNFKPY